jgi:hypothetical protein
MNVNPNHNICLTPERRPKARRLLAWARVVDEDNRNLCRMTTTVEL